MLKRLKQKLSAIKLRTTLELLLALQRAPEQRLSAEALGEATQLYAVAYPHLARLHRQGLVETRWASSETGPELTYVLTQQGEAFLATQQSRPADATPDAFLPSLRPLLARLAVWFG